MIQTVDGKKLKKGDLCFVVGVTVSGAYAPCRCKANSTHPDWFVPDESKVYSTWDACQEVCDEKNKLKQLNDI